MLIDRTWNRQCADETKRVWLDQLKNDEKMHNLFIERSYDGSEDISAQRLQWPNTHTFRLHEKYTGRYLDEALCRGTKGQNTMNPRKEVESLDETVNSKSDFLEELIEEAEVVLIDWWNQFFIEEATSVKEVVTKWYSAANPFKEIPCDLLTSVNIHHESMLTDFSKIYHLTILNFLGFEDTFHLLLNRGCHPRTASWRRIHFDYIIGMLSGDRDDYIQWVDQYICMNLRSFQTVGLRPQEFRDLNPAHPLLVFRRKKLVQIRGKALRQMLEETSTVDQLFYADFDCFETVSLALLKGGVRRSIEPVSADKTKALGWYRYQLSYPDRICNGLYRYVFDDELGYYFMISINEELLGIWTPGGHIPYTEKKGTNCITEFTC
ncbi:hypothetical protein F5Y16DRAFT_359801 [Xylariaceae sp. FL0255]|nr:hypothetical protein F5Y16DRAFT_359801 [Xylariaceae sp. FL0255]